MCFLLDFEALEETVWVLRLVGLLADDGPKPPGIIYHRAKPVVCDKENTIKLRCLRGKKKKEAWHPSVRVTAWMNHWKQHVCEQQHLSPSLITKIAIQGKKEKQQPAINWNKSSQTSKSVYISLQNSNRSAEDFSNRQFWLCLLGCQFLRSASS